MKNYKEIADSVLSRRDKYEKARKEKRKKTVLLTVITSCVLLAVISTVGIMKYGWIDNNLKIENSSSMKNEKTEAVKNYAEEDKSVTTTKKQTTEQKDKTTTEKKQETEQKSEIEIDGGGYESGGHPNGNGSFIPILPFDREIKITGEAITDSEAKKYFEANKERLVANLSGSGVPSDSIKISENGYCHINYDGKEGESFELRQNFRDYLVYNGDALVAIITLYKENGEIFSTPSLGAKWFKDYSSYLRAHKGEKLVYVYAGWIEIIISPDNSYYNPMGIDVSEYLNGVEKPYEMFYNELAVYVP